MEGGLSHYPMGGHTLMSDKGMAGVRVAGFGFRAAAKTESLYDAFIKAAEDKPIMALAAPRDKIDHPALQALAKQLAVPVYAIDEEKLTATVTPTQSAVVMEKRQTGSVAEAAALAFFSNPARLIRTRQISEDGLAVCAVAEGEAI